MVCCQSGWAVVTSNGLLDFEGQCRPVGLVVDALFLAGYHVNKSYIMVQNHRLEAVSQHIFRWLFGEQAYSEAYCEKSRLLDN